MSRPDPPQLTDLRRVPRPALERLQSGLTEPATTDATIPAPRGRRKFRDQPAFERRR